MKNKLYWGKIAGIVSLILGIHSVVSIPFIISSFDQSMCIIEAIIGIILSVVSKKAGFTGGVRKVGFVLSLITLSLFIIAAIILFFRMYRVFSMF